MAYTAFEEMRKTNQADFGCNPGPFQPELFQNPGNGFDLKSLAMKFIHDSCEGLLFKENAEEPSQGYRFSGTGIRKNQIPYNMQMDINRLCLERELGDFIDSGIAEDAYNVYYCFLEIFFGHYGKSKKMVELLSEFEANGSSLLMKHRDHYSHSVYVFALGLALYEASDGYRDIFERYCGLEGEEAAHVFLEYWGMTSLFHDIGYPFELPFEQVLSYFEVDNHERGKGSISLCYRNLYTLTGLSGEERLHFSELYDRDFLNTNEMFAFALFQKMGEIYGFSEDYMRDVLTRKPTEPESFGYFMDHAWFSANRLYREMVSSFGADNINLFHVDVLTAILLHNSLYKFAVAFYKDKDKAKAPLKAEIHPLAYMLMLCDELQCWDRTAYGRNSRTELQPMGADFDFNNGRIDVIYHFDAEEQEKIEEYNSLYREWEASDQKEGSKPPRLKAYSDMAAKEQKFVKDIEKIVDTGLIPLKVKVDTKNIDRSVKHTYLSNSNFMHLYDFAVALNARYTYEGRESEVSVKQLEDEFEAMSLEYQIYNIDQAKSFSRYLDAIGCFYTDRPVDYEMLKGFTKEQINVFSPMEHERWVRMHHDYGWRYGEEYEKLELKGACLDELKNMSEKELRRALRERFRCHKLAMDGEPTEEEIFAHYEGLSEEDQGKDWKPFGSMFKLIKKYDGLRIYSLGRGMQR